MHTLEDRFQRVKDSCQGEMTARSGLRKEYILSLEGPLLLHLTGPGLHVTLALSVWCACWSSTLRYCQVRRPLLQVD
jgi:hypothetical protein